ncbi:hypothetical protein [Streptomyces canus]|uniref:hypothetical protein n=1 Tax=Streptomyces canus TaxID=58343 RepID=UPI00131A0985|nr:hypothetical protein [Streptomyces canus]
MSREQVKHPLMWRLGDPARVGEVGWVPIELSSLTAPDDALLVGAVNLVLARYRAGEPVDESATVGEFLASCEVTQPHVVIDEVDAGARLAPSLPAVVRFSRGDLDSVIVKQFAAHVYHFARQLAERPDRPLVSVKSDDESGDPVDPQSRGKPGPRIGRGRREVGSASGRAGRGSLCRKTP